MAEIPGLRDTVIVKELSAAFLIEPPGWTRLEPQSVSGDPTPGMEARVHDPLWLLSRQWQLGEFEGEDAGTPVSVEVTASWGRVDAMRPGNPSAAVPQADTVPWDGLHPLDPAIERDPVQQPRPGLRTRVEGGSQFLVMLDSAGLTAMRARTLELSALSRDAWETATDDPDRPAESRLRKLFGGRVPDAERLAGQIVTSRPARAGAALRAGLAPDVAAALDGVVGRWWDWYRGQVAPTEPNPAWIDERLEYGFRVGIATSGGQTVLDSPAFGGGRVDWHAFDAAGEDVRLPPPQKTASDATGSRTQKLLATPLRFAGMPADRYWEFEDGQVNLGALDVQPHDLGRLALVECGLVYGNDWLVVPFDVPVGSLTVIGEVVYTDTFERSVAVQAADPGPAGQRFRLFEIASSDDGAIPGLFCPPTAPARLEGRAVEDVLFARDEMANMAWGVERRVQGPSGTARERSDEPGPAPLQHRAQPPADLDYLLQTEIPARWIPFVPSPRGPWEIELRKGALLDRNQNPVHPEGVVLRPRRAMVIADEEIPREGVRVERVPVLCRDPDGNRVRWITRRVRVGRGEAASALAYDSAIRRPERE